MKVGIKKGKQKGTIFLNEETMAYGVVFPDKKVRAQIKRYLEKEREYRIPESQEIDDFRLERAVPTKSPMHFDLALCTLWANTGVYVIWGAHANT
jgi:hypothetical protein